MQVLGNERLTNPLWQSMAYCRERIEDATETYLACDGLLATEDHETYLDEVRLWVRELVRYGREAIAAAETDRRKYGVGSLLGNGTSNAKTAKSDRAQDRYLTWIMYLTPLSDFGSLCPKASKGCAAACLYTAGRGGMSNVQRARLSKTRWYFRDRETFLTQLYLEIGKAERKAKRLGKRAAIRLNGTSDVVWERVAPWVLAAYPDIQFYDYTKIAKRFEPTWDRPANYYLTFSRSESNGAECFDVQTNGGNVCVVYSGPLPRDWHDADATDLRFLDPGADPRWNAGLGRIVGVSAKGAAKHDDSGFVVHTDVHGPTC